MEIHKYLRTERADAAGRYPIRLWLHANNWRLPISTGEKVSEKGWDKKKEKVKGTEPYYLQINNRLANLEAILGYVYTALVRSISRNSFGSIRNAPTEQITKETVKKGYEAVLKYVEESGQPEVTESLIVEAWEAYTTPKTAAPAISEEDEEDNKLLNSNFFELMEIWIDEEAREIDIRTGRRRSPNTIKAYRSSINKLIEFEVFSCKPENKGKPLTLGGMSMTFYNALRDWMLIKREPIHEVNYFGKIVGHLTQFLGWCELKHENLVVHRHYTRFEAPSVYIGVDFLLMDEFLAIKNLDFKSDEVRIKLKAGYSCKLREDLWLLAFEDYVNRVELARDIFLMCCYTALRISDCQDFSLSWIVGELIIKEDTTKTAADAYIPYYDDDIFEPVTLVEKYAGSEDRIFPKCPTINKLLKVVQKLADVKRIELTTKIGRKTFVTMKVYQGVPTKLIMKATTHQSERDFNRYLGVDTKELVEAFKSRSINLAGAKKGASGAEVGAEKVNLLIPA